MTFKRSELSIYVRQYLRWSELIRTQRGAETSALLPVPSVAEERDCLTPRVVVWPTAGLQNRIDDSRVGHVTPSKRFSL